MLLPKRSKCNIKDMSVNSKMCCSEIQEKGYKLLSNNTLGLVFMSEKSWLGIRYFSFSSDHWVLLL